MSEFYVNWKKWNCKVVFNRSCCHENYKNVTFYLSIKIFHQYIFQLPSLSLWVQPFSSLDLANDIQLFRKRLSEKVLATIPKGILVGFECTVLQRNLKELARKSIKMCSRVLTESNKSRFDSYSRQEQCIDHIPYYLTGLSRVHFFPTTFLEIAVYTQTAKTCVQPP